MNIRLRDREIPFLLNRSRRRRRIVLSVDERGLAVNAPWRSSRRHILEVVRDAESWVLKKLRIWSAYPVRRQSWADGDRTKFLGGDLVLRLIPDPLAGIVTLDDDHRLRVHTPRPEDPVEVKAAVIAWYRRHALSDFGQRIDRFAARLGVAPPRMFLSNARTRWGSCNADRQVRLNWRLIQATPSTIDYVVAHELAHLIEMNHSRRFWRIVAGVCPGHMEARAELESMGRYYLDI